MAWLILPAGIFTADYFMKKKAESWSEEEPPRKVLGGHIILQRLHNRGAVLGFCQARPHLLAGCTAGLTAGLAAAYVWLMGRSTDALLKTGVGMLLGGSMSNVWDRLRRHYVVDYFSFNTKCARLRKIVFNLSDLFIFLGGFLVICWNALRKS
ncbi:MAG: signal peptidase II [Firmicutes bacterium]|nr:signal peptidase II [Bacillota bacterium]MDY2820055.1 signal peptidase II [Hominisplanchenecus sp.]